MLIIAGHVAVDPARRDDFVSAFAELVRRSRQAPGCLDLAVTADPVEPGRVNNLERWESREAVAQWRAVCDPPEVGAEILAADVRMWDAANERDPFDL